MTLNNGPLLMVSGSHTGPTFDHHQDGFFAGAIDPTRNQIDFAKAEPLTGKAGSCTFHHARPIHGSATNHSSSSRRLLLFQIATSDAWDLSGMDESDWKTYEKTILAGKPFIEARAVITSIRKPFSKAKHQGSIYENQSILKNHFFLTN